VLARRILESEGYRVLETTDAAQAITLSDAHGDEIHLLLTDVVMPELSGRELAARLHSARPDMRVLFMSGYTDDAIVRHGIAPGVAYLQKPFTPDSLLRKVREVLSNLPI
jgi:CheY-like chemotaxis protein